MSWFELGYIGLFFVCFLSATILPFPSEGALIAFLAAGYSPVWCLIVATLGNTLGGTTNYALGLLGNPDKLENRFKNKEQLHRFRRWVNRYGYWLGLIAWTPFIGDPMTIAIGFFRVKFVPFFLLMTLGKFVRYAVIIYLWID